MKKGSGTYSRECDLRDAEGNGDEARDDRHSECLTREKISVSQWTNTNGFEGRMWGAEEMDKPDGCRGDDAKYKSDSGHVTQAGRCQGKGADLH